MRFVILPPQAPGCRVNSRGICGAGRAPRPASRTACSALARSAVRPTAGDVAPLLDAAHGVGQGARPAKHAARSTLARCAVSPTTGDVAPLLDAVRRRGDQNGDVPFHVPGHKRGRGVHPRFNNLVSNGVLAYDLTEIEGLDYLSSPTGVIAEAQRLAAAAFGAQQTWFLVNGCSVGIHAAVMACAGPGDTLLVSRNCHMSAFSAMVLSGCEPLWLLPEVDDAHGIAHCVTPDTLTQAFQQAGQAGLRVPAVLLVSPTYFGAAARLTELAAICHDHGAALLVDEAHGGHFGLCPACPPSALSCGADLVMQSTHKVLSAMTQAAMLHSSGGPRVDPARVSHALQVLQTSSPSYVLLASLDAARLHAQQPHTWEQPLAAAQIICAGLQSVKGVSLVGDTSDGNRDTGCSSASSNSSSSASSSSSSSGRTSGTDSTSSSGGNSTSSSSSDASVFGYDPLRFCVNVSGLGCSGWDAATWLEHEFGIVSELATQQLVVFVLGPGTLVADGEALVAAVRALAASRIGPGASRAHAAPDRQDSGEDVPSGASTPASDALCGVALPERRLTPRDAFFRPSVQLPQSECVGRVSSELLCPYPPGVPLIFPGEVISREVLHTLTRLVAAGGTVTGAKDSTLATLRVVV